MVELIRTPYTTYAFCLRKTLLPGAYTPLTFTSSLTCEHFIRRLDNAAGSLRRLAAACDNYRDWRSNHYHHIDDYFIAGMLRLGRIRVYVVDERIIFLPAITAEQNAAPAIYALVPPSYPLAHGAVNVISLNDKIKTATGLAVTKLTHQSIKILLAVLAIKTTQVHGDVLAEQVVKSLEKGDLLLMGLPKIMRERIHYSDNAAQWVHPVPPALLPAAQLFNGASAQLPMGNNSPANPLASMLKMAALTGQAYCEKCGPPAQPYQQQQP